MADKNYYDWEIEIACLHAALIGYEVIRTAQDLLLLDLDTDAAIGKFARKYAELRDRLDLYEIQSYPSTSRIGRHVVCRCCALNFPARIAVQIIMGSDPVREELGLLMWHDGIPDPSVLFRPAWRYLLESGAA